MSFTSRDFTASHNWRLSPAPWKRHYGAGNEVGRSTLYVLAKGLMSNSVRWENSKKTFQLNINEILHQNFFIDTAFRPPCHKDLLHVCGLQSSPLPAASSWRLLPKAIKCFLLSLSICPCLFGWDFPSLSRLIFGALSYRSFCEGDCAFRSTVSLWTSYIKNSNSNLCMKGQSSTPYFRFRFLWLISIPLFKETWINSCMVVSRMRIQVSHQVHLLLLKNRHLIPLYLIAFKNNLS